MLHGSVSSVQKTSATTVSAVGRSHTQHESTMQNASQSLVSISENDKSRFWANVDIRGEDECWLWNGNRTWRGYGQVYIQRKTIPTHRAAWMLTNGEIPDGMFVCHRCDNPPCCNPAHLWLGTNAENMADKCAKGRQASGDKHPARKHPERMARGESNGRSKLTAELVRSLRMDRESGYTYSALSNKYGISWPVARGIATRKTWKHVDDQARLELQIERKGNA